MTNFNSFQSNDMINLESFTAFITSFCTENDSSFAPEHFDLTYFSE